jgi:hypothetical protein
MLLIILVLEKKRIEYDLTILIPNNTYNIGSQ